MHPLQLQRRLTLALVFAAALAHEAQAQLAITEVMSATKVNTNTSFRGPEYWELTNFGTNQVDLHGYGFRDSVQTHDLARDPFTNLVIGGGESVIFFRVESTNQSVTNMTQFRAWWGESKLPPNLQARSWKSPGLSGWDGDALWLFDASGKVVDSVQFGRARPGRAFTYESESGLFPVLSAVGVDSAFAAEMADDVGSPGFTTGPSSVRFLQQPIDQSVDGGMTVEFAVTVAGLPRPQFQWLARGLPIGNSTSTLILSNVQLSNAGPYQVVLTNGLSTATSAVATLIVNTNPTPPTVLNSPVDASVFNGQTAVFTVSARGFPAPGYKWKANGADIAGATSSTLALVDVSPELSGTRYSVQISNSLGSTNVSALLTVTRRPDLRFTEIMALPADENANRHFDWFELTNYDTNAVNLHGWRFSDEPAFALAFTITNALTLQPGESAVFAERLNERLFAAWWGSNSLSPAFKLCSYSGFGLGYLGETLFLWNPAATDPYDTVATVSWAAATLGVSFECEHYCDPDGFGCLDEATKKSVLGLRGAFRASDGGDIGSPGYVANPPLAILSISRETEGLLSLRCRVSAGKTYRLCRSPSLSLATWDPLEARTATNNAITLTDEVATAGSNWFYRVEELP